MAAFLKNKIETAKQNYDYYIGLCSGSHLGCFGTDYPEIIKIDYNNGIKAFATSEKPAYFYGNGTNMEVTDTYDIPAWLNEQSTYFETNIPSIGISTEIYNTFTVNKEDGTPFYYNEGMTLLVTAGAYSYPLMDEIPEGLEINDFYTVGDTNDIYVFDGTQWVGYSKSKIPTGGTTGQVLSKTGDGDYETAWKDVESGGIPELIGTQEAPVLLYNIIETGIYKIIGSYKQIEAGNTTNNDGGSLIFYVDKDKEGNITQRFWATKNAFSMQARVALAFAGGAELLKNTSFSNYTMVSDLQMDGADKFVNAIALRNSIGYNDKNSLQTTDKSSLVAAINELNTRLAALENPTE